MATENKFGKARTKVTLPSFRETPFMKKTTPEERFQILIYGLLILGELALMTELYTHLPHR